VYLLLLLRRAMTDRGNLSGCDSHAYASRRPPRGEPCGDGGLSYINNVIIEDANLSGDAVLETRWYLLQIWCADVVAVGCWRVADLR